MSGYFEEKLWELLPAIYRVSDETGDLDAFLRVIGPTLNELKALIDDFPRLVDVDRCDARFLPLLGSLVGHGYDATRDTTAQRREIREAVETYRRKGTLPALRRSLANLDWQGRIQETHRTALRLNRRARVGAARLPGRIYSLGVYRVENQTQPPGGFREALAFHHPAGTKAYFLQWLADPVSAEAQMVATSAARVQRQALARLNEAFVLGRHALNADVRLNRRIQSWQLANIQYVATFTVGITRAHTRIARWHARRPGIQLNRHALNADRLVSLWVSDRKAILDVSISIDSPSGHGSRMRLSQSPLNRHTIPHAEPASRFVFRQENLEEATLSGFQFAANQFTATRWPQDEE